MKVEIGYYLIFHSTEGGSVVIFDKQCILILPIKYTKKRKTYSNDVVSLPFLKARIQFQLMIMEF